MWQWKQPCAAVLLHSFPISSSLFLCTKKNPILKNTKTTKQISFCWPIVSSEVCKFEMVSSKDCCYFKVQHSSSRRCPQFYRLHCATPLSLRRIRINGRCAGSSFFILIFNSGFVCRFQFPTGQPSSFPIFMHFQKKHYRCVPVFCLLAFLHYIPIPIWHAVSHF